MAVLKKESNGGETAMRSFPRQLLISIVAGLCLSAVLFFSSYATQSTALFWPQAIGIFICWLLRGVHTATKADYALIAIPVNAVVYAAVILVLLKLLGSTGNPAGRATPSHGHLTSGA